MKKILFPTDFSKPAKYALNVAVSLAKREKAEIVLLHSLNTVQQFIDISLSSTGDMTLPGMQPEVVMEVIKNQKSRAEKEMQDLVNELKSQNLLVSSHIISQALDTELNDFIDSHQIDFIVMGTKGASGLEEAFIGSNAQKIVRISKVPVLTVNGHIADFDVKNVHFFSDFIEDAVVGRLPEAVSFAKYFKANFKAIFINTPTYFEESLVVEKRISSVIEKQKFKNIPFEIFNAFDIDEGIIKYANNHQTDIIVMVTHGFKGLKKMFNDNVTESVVNHSKIPVLVYHTK